MKHRADCFPGVLRKTFLEHIWEDADIQPAAVNKPDLWIRGLALLWQIYSPLFLRRSRIGSADIAEDLIA